MNNSNQQFSLGDIERKQNVILHDHNKLVAVYGTEVASLLQTEIVDKELAHAVNE